VASAVENALAAYSGTTAAPHEYFDHTGCGYAVTRWSFSPENRLAQAGRFFPKAPAGVVVCLINETARLDGRQNRRNCCYFKAAPTKPHAEAADAGRLTPKTSTTS
jgi:hypothetical protein